VGWSKHSRENLINRSGNRIGQYQPERD
jgi:hypothetical protein